jgi:plastocyanin
MPQGVNPGDTHNFAAKSGKNYDVKFNEDGFPDFSPHQAKVGEGQKNEVKIDVDGTYEGGDFSRADILPRIMICEVS